MSRRMTFSSRALKPWLRASSIGSSQNLQVLFSRSTCTCAGSLQSKLVKKTRYGPGMPLILGIQKCSLLFPFAQQWYPPNPGAACERTSRRTPRSAAEVSIANLGPLERLFGVPTAPTRLRAYASPALGHGSQRHASACLRSAATANSNHSPGTPFNEWRPRSSKRMPDPATRSLTVLDTRISPGPA